MPRRLMFGEQLVEALCARGSRERNGDLGVTTPAVARDRDVFGKSIGFAFFYFYLKALSGLVVVVDILNVLECGPLRRLQRLRERHLQALFGLAVQRDGQIVRARCVF